MVDITHPLLGGPLTDFTKVNEEFTAWTKEVGPRLWAKFDLSAARIGWEAGQRAALTQPAAEPVASDDLRAQIFNKLGQIAVAGCNCNTKTPDLEHHSERCHYRLAEEIWPLVARATAAPPSLGQIKALEEEIDRLKESVRDRAACEALQYERAEEAERMLAREIDVASLLQTRAEAAETALAEAIPREIYERLLRDAKREAVRECAQRIRAGMGAPKLGEEGILQGLHIAAEKCERMASEHERGSK
jgi:hypothetical protein